MRTAQLDRGVDGCRTRAVRVDEAERLRLASRAPNYPCRAAAAKKSAPQADLRGSVAYKKNLAGVLVARGLRQALGRLGVNV
jgi:CO/xanthine dehydrogenase FAD-binding subunit